MRKPKFKLIAGLVAVVLLIGALSTWITGTLAAKPDYTQDFTTNPNQGYTVLEKGQQWGPTYISGMVFATPSDPTIATSTASSNKLTVTGLKAGVFKVTYSNKRGQLASAAFQIKDSANLQRYSITNNAQGVIQNVGGTLSVPITTVPSTLGVPIKWSSMDTSVATVNENTGLITATGEGATVIIGETVDMWGVTRTISYSITVGKSGSNNVIQDSTTGKYYLPTDNPYIFIECDKNGIPKVPVVYVYDADKNPANGITAPAIPCGGKFYVEDPAGSNIFKEIDPTLGKVESPAIWGGPDHTLNTPDDKPAIKGGNGIYYVATTNPDDNTYVPVIGTGTGLPIICAGPDLKPGNGDDKNNVVTGKDGKHYLDNGDGSYMAYGPDGKLGTADDIKLYPGPDGEIGTPDDSTNPQPVLPAKLMNGGFEQCTGIYGTTNHLSPSNVPYWKTTGTEFEIDKLLNDFSGNHTPSEGSYFCELNSNKVTNIYQDIRTVPGQVLYWTIDHRGRAGTDTAQLSIGAPGTTNVIRTMTDGNKTWGKYSGTYTVPAGQYVTRFLVISYSATAYCGDNVTLGNLIDNCSLQTQ